MSGRAGSVYVFLGPSLRVDEAREVLAAEYLPPVKMGDVQALLARKPRVVCIVDGYFERVPAVWHKEILYALSQGVRVVGASSMGALRAAELCSFGMEGVGGIFEAFRDWTLTADDEVAIVHTSAEEGFRPSSEALVNIRDGLALAEARGIISPAEREALVAAAKATFYPERAWARVLSDAQTAGIEPDRVARLRAFLASERPNAKRRDAVAALEYVAATIDRAPSPASFEFEPTEFWHRLVSTTARTALGGPDGEASDGPVASAVVDYARLAVDDYRALRDRALLWLLASTEAERAGLRIAPEAISAAAERFRLRHGLLSAERTREWLAANALTPEDFTALCRLDAVCDELAAQKGRALEQALADMLKRFGLWADYTEALQRRDVAIARAGLANSSLEDAGIDTRGLLAWYKERFRPMDGGIDAHAKERGFGDVSAFLREALKQYCAEK